MGNREFKISNKIKEEIEKGFSLRETTPSCACEQVLERGNRFFRFRSTIRVSQYLLSGDFDNGKLPYFSKSKS